MPWPKWDPAFTPQDPSESWGRCRTPGIFRRPTTAPWARLWILRTNVAYGNTLGLAVTCKKHSCGRITLSRCTNTLMFLDCVVHSKTKWISLIKSINSTWDSFYAVILNDSIPRKQFLLLNQMSPHGPKARNLFILQNFFKNLLPYIVLWLLIR